MSPFGLPCNPPPWGVLQAIDLATGSIRWQAPLGTTRDILPVPISIGSGTPNLGGPMTTAGGLVFIGAAMDNYLRAFDVETGRELWKGRLPLSESGRISSECFTFRKSARRSWSSDVRIGFPVSGFTTLP